MQTRFDVRPVGSAYAVFDRDGAQVSGLLVREHAFTRADNLERLARLAPRKCLTCGETFNSEGPHNRMCLPCKVGTRDHAPTYQLSL